ncbi:MAG: hypothetical protein J7L71_00295 [Spirochaetaceae bacterium]|nr:hypothetical protein [Spirochaetaceae bacterium]
MKKLLLGFLSLLFVLQMASGIPKVAVLDASLGSGVDINAAAIVADTLNEQFVKSNDFIAIDRAYISSIQQEKKFQLSGDVNQSDIKKMGDTFGAEFICIANVSQLGSTYTVSARLIEVETAQVVSQESARKQGQIDVLFNVAEEVGKKLIGKEITDNTSQAEVEKKKTVTTPAPVKNTTPSNKPHTFSRTSISYMMPSFNGSGYDILQSWLDSYFGAGNYEPWTAGFDIHSLITISKYYYFAVSGSFGFESITSYISDSFYDFDTDYLSFSNMDLRLTAGGIYPIGNMLQFYGGLGLGYQYIIISDETWDISTFPEYEYGAFVYGIELGGDFKLSDFVFSIRFQTGMSTFPAASVFDGYEQDFGYTAFMIGLGYVF